MIRPLDTDALSRQFREAEPFPFVMIDDFLDRDFALEVARSIPPFEEAKAVGHHFETVNEHRKVQLTDRSRFPGPVQALLDLLHGPEWLAQLEHITGIRGLMIDERMLGGGLHQTARRGRLDVHADFNFIPDVDMFRRLNLLLYLNPEWDAAWGGELELWNRDVTSCVHSLEPVLGRCVVFATGTTSFHGTTRVRCPEGTTRKSFALYYYSFEPPPGFDDQDFQGTVFRARPNEIVKGKLLMPLEKAWHKAAWNVKKVGARLRRRRLDSDRPADTYGSDVDTPPRPGE